MYKKLLSFLIIFTLAVPSAVAVSFEDVPENHIYYAAIESLKNLEIISGHPDGTFKPADPVIRAESLKMILNSADIEVAVEYGEIDFPDVPEDAWYNMYLYKAVVDRIVNGNEDGTFAPSRQVNKAEFLKMLLESFEIDLSKHRNLTEGVSADTAAGDWYLPYMSYAKTLGIIFPTMDNRLEPGKDLSRGECAEIIYKLLIIETGGDTQKLLSIAEANLVSVLIEIGNNDIQAAIDSANSAVFYTEKALEKDSDTGIVKAANKIARGFLELTLGYQAGLEGRTEDLIGHVETAKDLAGQAFADDPSTQSLGQKLKAQGDILLGQI